MRKLRIEIPNYELRSTDANTIAILANQYDLTYESSVSPILAVSDVDTEEIILTSSGVMRCYISGDESNVEKFLEELEAWFTEF